MQAFEPATRLHITAGEENESHLCSRSLYGVTGAEWAQEGSETQCERLTSKSMPAGISKFSSFSSHCFPKVMVSEIQQPSLSSEVWKKPFLQRPEGNPSVRFCASISDFYKPPRLGSRGRGTLCACALRSLRMRPAPDCHAHALFLNAAVWSVGRRCGR